MKNLSLIVLFLSVSLAHADERSDAKQSALDKQTTSTDALASMLRDTPGYITKKNSFVVSAAYLDTVFQQRIQAGTITQADQVAFNMLRVQYQAGITSLTDACTTATTKIGSALTLDAEADNSYSLGVNDANDAIAIFDYNTAKDKYTQAIGNCQDASDNLHLEDNGITSTQNKLNQAYTLIVK